jgi:hypothetical protein
LLVQGDLLADNNFGDFGSFEYGEEFSGAGPVFPPGSPNFQRLFHQHQFQLEGNPTIALPHHSKPPRRPPSKANLASVLRKRVDLGQENSPNNFQKLRNMSDDATEEGANAIRSSPRINKGQNSRFDSGSITNRIPRKASANPKQVPDESDPTGIHVSESTKNFAANSTDSNETAEDSAEAPDDSLENGKVYFPDVETSEDAKLRLSSVQRMALLKQRVGEWKKATSNKKRDQLIKELIQAKKKLFHAEANFENILLQNKKMLDSARNTSADRDEKGQQVLELTDKLRVKRARFDEVVERLEKTLVEKVMLEKKLANAIKNKASLRAKGGNKHRMVENEVLLSLLETKAKTMLWGHVKFIQSAEEERDAAKYLVKYGDIPKEYRQTKEMRADLVEMYSEKIKRAVFQKRNYTTAEIKKYYVKMWKAGKDTLSVEDLLICLKREIKTDDDTTKFMLYWEEYLPKQVGASEWDKNVRYYNTISQATRMDCKSHELPLVTPEDEAFLVLSVKNGIARWKEDFDRSQLGTKKTKEDEKDNGGLYTSTTSGQNQYGGWNEEGLELYQTYREWNIQAREDPNSLQVEKECLRKLRLKWGIECATAIEHNKLQARKKSAKKRGRGEEPQPVMKKIIRTMRPIEDSDEDTDSDE